MRPVRPFLALPLALAACTSLDPLYRAERDVPDALVVAAAESDRPEDAAALVLLAELGARGMSAAPGPETLATAFEGLARRAGQGTLPPAHAALAARAGADLALDDLQPAALRMNACELLAALGPAGREALANVRDDAGDPLVANHAERLLAPDAD